MGKTIKLTEEQIRRFFGEGFGKRLIGEEYINNKDPHNVKLQQKDLYKNAYDKSGIKSYNPEMGNYFSGLNYGARISKAFPSKIDAQQKLFDFGNLQILPKESPDDIVGNTMSFNTGDNDAILKALYEMNGKKPIGLIDALRIFMKIANKELPEDNINNNILKNFLNGFNVTSILSNFLNFKCPDYVYFRLLNLSKDEIDIIDKQYGKDFGNWGMKCDGCGITKWKTNVFANAHDDAHINLEYMGGMRAYEGDNIKEEIDVRQAMKNKTSTRLNWEEYDIPFQIHHMNENASDNSPLNLACLCPNCHAITGSYGKQKSGIKKETFDFLKDFTDVKGNSILSSMDEKEVDMLANSIKRGDFEAMNFTNSAYGISDDVSSSEVENGIQWSSIYLNPDLVSDSIFKNAGINPNKKTEFIDMFNGLFYRLFDEAQEMFDKIYSKKLNEAAKKKQKDDEEFSKVNIDQDDEKEVFVGKRTITDNFADVDLVFEIKVSKNGGYIQLMVYEGKAPDYLRAVSNNPITLNRMFWSPGGNEAVRLSEIKRIRTSIFYMIINNIRDTYNNITRMIPKVGFTRQTNGKTSVNRSAVKNAESIRNSFENVLQKTEVSDEEYEMSKIGNIVRTILRNKNDGRFLKNLKNNNEALYNAIFNEEGKTKLTDKNLNDDVIKDILAKTGLSAKKFIDSMNKK